MLSPGLTRMREAEVIVRRAGPGDLETLREFEQGIIAAERPYDPTIRKDPVRYYDIAVLIASDDVCLALAEADGRAIGCGFARRSPSRPYTEPPYHAYVGLMYVAPEFRGRGVSRQILEALSAWARAKGLFEVRLEVYPGNAVAVSAYENFGFSPYMTEMRLRLDESQ